jgi:MinD-like ATPase involved in chromosome partitioning or flagellar assembly
MTIVAVAGDACTTTTVALAAAWPSSANAIVVEADPTGGDLAAWFDLPVEPSLSTLVTRTIDGSFAEVDRHTRLAASGLRLITAPPRAGEAQQAVAEAARSIVATLSTPRAPTVVVDTGRLAQQSAVHPFLEAASVIVLVHRQATQSAGAAAVRLQRLAEQIEACDARAASLVVTVIGAAPFDLDEIETFLADGVGRRPVIGLPVDELAASVYAGRIGVSARRLARLPLPRAAGDLALAVLHALGDRAPSFAGSAG